MNTVTTPLLQEAEALLKALPRGGIKKLAEQLNWTEGRLRQIAKGMNPTGNKRLGSGHNQVQRVVYELLEREIDPLMESECRLP